MKLSPSKIIDSLINFMKWPTACVTTLMLFPAFQSSLELLYKCAEHFQVMIYFIIGFGIYFILWFYLIRKLGITILSTLEHELTHGLFALLTFHKILDLRTTWNRGGHIRFEGKGNWLITIAPYFFPTVCMFLIAFFSIVPIYSIIGEVMIGVAFAYHLTSALRETHIGQSDLRKVGYIFSLAFLPCANLISSGVVVAYVFGGFVTTREFLNEIIQRFLASIT